MADVNGKTFFLIEEIESAINRYRHKHQPAPDADDWFVMDRRLSRMADVYGAMIVGKKLSIARNSLDKEVDLLFAEWMA